MTVKPEMSSPDGVSIESYGGVLDQLVAGDWVNPKTGERHGIPPKAMVIAASLDGAEADLIAARHRGKSIMVVSDSFTREALGRRVFEALKPLGNVTEYVWAKPSCSEDGVKQLQEDTRGAEVLIAVGSGTVNDSIKYATYLDGRDYSVFATSPMNAYSTSTASVSFGGFKKSIPCHGAKGIYYDLSVIAKCPPRLISAAFADVICRTTAQVDWLMSHILFDTPYSDTPYVLLNYDEGDMIANADKMLSGSVESLAMLTRISAIMGLGTSFTGTTHCGSMAEHMISHYIDMFAGEAHPRTSHGEQVGVATLSLSKLQNRLLNADHPPVMRPTVIPEAELHAKFGADYANMMIEQTRLKALDQREADRLNQLFADDWDGFADQLRAVMLPYERVKSAMEAAHCQLTGEELGLPAGFYSDAVRYARFIRERFSALDLADDSGQLESYAQSCV
ncbi:iron-containing alcohol dehydrogenase [Denitrobaculum tricleocarpae]|uniref:sn-glycerol-1-phosphate dehydrogenase n=1 Tax=Denitrobaculum tricleocarpae TaxID=2591009 RepID=A0A545SZB2_9PROT|nr:iron-containing alcohol dehydrogenase [Denitrobaculum tricleocarpae]TQV70315.1 sn-glycerol-1-phosphate dehydrogenase [Denitrobaculum tricleocarpae]